MLCCAVLCCVCWTVCVGLFAVSRDFILRQFVTEDMRERELEREKVTERERESVSEIYRVSESEREGAEEARDRNREVKGRDEIEADRICSSQCLIALITDSHCPPCSSLYSAVQRPLCSMSCVCV